jgi:hypothetical protein
MAAPIARDILAEAIRLDPARVANRRRPRKEET